MSETVETQHEDRCSNAGAVQDAGPPAARWHVWIAVLLPVALLLPFLNKTVHIDDAAYIAIAKHIVEHPFDYYGIALNWDGTSRPAYQWHASPPLANYYLAFVGAVFGWKEWVLHAGFLVPAALAGVGTLWLARRTCKRPLLALLAAVCTPAFVVSGTTLMLDMWLLAFIVLSLASWVTGVQSRQVRWFVLGALCAGLAAWTKYFGIALLPALAAYTMLAPHRPKKWLLFLALPVAMIAAEQCYCYAHYGRSLFVNAAHVAMEERVDRPWWLWLLLGLSFCGGSTFSVMQIGAVLWNARLSIVGTFLVALTSIAMCVLDARGFHALTMGLDLPVVSLVLFTILVFGGTQLFSFVYVELRGRRDPESWLLVLWAAGTFVFAACVTWSMNVRSVLPLVPIAAVFAARRLDTIAIVDPKKTTRRIAIALVMSTLISLGVARADFEWAQSARAAADHYARLAESHPGHVYFQGHWGFQHYMMEAGVPPLDFETTVLQPGDIVICPRNNANVRPLPAEFTASRSVEQFPVAHRMATMSVDLGAGFYSDLWGPLPFALGLKMPPDDYYVYHVSKAGKPFAGAMN